MRANNERAHRHKVELLSHLFSLALSLYPHTVAIIAIDVVTHIDGFSMGCEKTEFQR